jgi:hypothetical protein
MEDTLRFCAILHNMVCAYRRSQYNGTRANRLRDEQGEVTDLPVLADEEIAARLTRPPECEAEAQMLSGERVLRALKSLLSTLG